MTSFGDMLRNLRKSRRVILGDLADRIGLRASQLSDIELDRVPPPGANILARVDLALELRQEEREELVAAATADDHLGHRWQLGRDGVRCSLCRKPRIRSGVPYPCWPPCRECGKPMVDHNDDPDDMKGTRRSDEFCWRRYAGACTGIDRRLAALDWCRAHNAHVRFESDGSVSIRMNGTLRRRANLVDAVDAFESG